MECYKCKKEFNIAFASCGTGTTWSLHECPHCKQLYADGSIIPREALEDGKVIVLKDN